jgi:hypothetical protein
MMVSEIRAAMSQFEGEIGCGDLGTIIEILIQSNKRKNKMNLKLKKLTSMLTLASFCCSPLLTACNGGSGSTSNQLTQQNITNSQQKIKGDSPFNKTTIWGNVTQRDGKNSKSHNYFFVSNNLLNDAKLIGCDNDSNSDGFKATMSDIPAKFTSPRTNDFEHKWDRYAENGYLFDSKHLADYNMYFGSDVSKNKDYTCWYEATIPNTNQQVDFGVRANIEYSETIHGQDTLNQPREDKKIMQNSTGFNDPRSIGTIVNGALFIIQGIVWSNFQKKYKSAMSSLKLYDEEIVRELRVGLGHINDELSEGNYDAIRKALGLKESVSDEQIVKMLGLDDSGAIIVRNTNGTIDIVMPNNQSLAQIKAKNYNLFKPNVAREKLQIRSAERVADSEGINIEDPEVIKKLEGAYDINEKNFVNRFAAGGAEYDIGDALRIDSDFARFSETSWGKMARFASLFGRFASTIGVTADALALAVPFIIAACDHDSPFGNYDTSIAEYSIVTPNSSAAARAAADAFNKSHDPTHQVHDNATIIGGAGNNSIDHTYHISYNGKGLDKQLGIDVSLTAASTPWIRLDYNNADGAKYSSLHDPYLGNNSVAEGKDHQHDTVMVLSIGSSNKASTLDNTEYDLMHMKMQDLGLDVAAQDTRLNAPVGVLHSIVNTQNNKVIYQQGQNGGLLKGTANGLVQVGDMQGIVLNDDQQVNLDVSIAPNNIAAAGVKAGGMALSLDITDPDTGDSTSIMSVKSDGLKALLESKGDKAPTFLYNEFTCDYPYVVGSSCPLQLMLGGKKITKRASGKIYFANEYSSTSAGLPVFINTHLIQEKNSAVVDPTGMSASNLFELDFKNLSSKDYTSLIINNLPQGIKAVSNTCEHGLNSMTECKIVYDASSVEDYGDSTLTIQGLYQGQSFRSDADSSDPDTVNFNLTINPPM